MRDEERWKRLCALLFSTCLFDIHEHYFVAEYLHAYFFRPGFLFESHPSCARAEARFWRAIFTFLRLDLPHRFLMISGPIAGFLLFSLQPIEFSFLEQF